MTKKGSCVIPNCRNSLEKTAGSDVIYQKFPLKEKIRRRWLRNIQGTFKSFTIDSTATHRLCSDHFDQSCFTLKNGKRIFTLEAVPSIFRTKDNVTVKKEVKKEKVEVEVRPRTHTRRAASKEALKQMQILLEDEDDAVEIPDDDEVVPVPTVAPPKKKYKLTHRKSSDGNDREVLVLKSITPSITNHYVENNLELECWVEELEPCQKERNKKLEEEEKAMQSKLDELIKACKGEVVYKGEHTTVIEVAEHVQKTIQAIQASQNKPPIVLNSSVANPGYQLVMDPRLGLIVGTVQGSKQTPSKQTPPKQQGKIQVATNLQASPVTPTNNLPNRGRISRSRKSTTPVVQPPAPPPPPPAPVATRSVVAAAATTRSVTPSGATTRSVTPSGATTRSVTPSGATTRSVTPSGATTRSVTPSGATTRSVTPSGATTRSVAPSGATSRSVVPAGATTRSVVPAGVTTRSVMPAGTTTRSVVPAKQTTAIKRPAPQPVPAGPPATRSRASPAAVVGTVRPTETSVEGGLTTGTNLKPKAIVDLTTDDGKPLPDSREVSFNKLQGKTFPSLVVVARPHLRVTDVNSDRSKLDLKVKAVLMYAPTKFTEWLIQQGLVKSEQKCSVHNTTQLKLGMYSDVSKFPYSGGYVWISECCPQRFVSVFSGSIFEGSPHPPLVILKIIYHWACQTNIQNVTQWVKVDNLYVKGMYTWLRSICSVALQTHIRQLGGPQAKVEVGVISLGTTSQDGNSRQVKVEVLGILESTTKLIRLRAIEPLAENDRNYKKRFSKILEPLVQWVNPSSIIVTDLTVDKATLHQMGFANVVQSTSGDANNSNRTIMEYLRRIVPRMFQNTLSLLSRQIIQQFLDELVWREWFGTTSMQAFDNLVAHLAEQTRHESNIGLTVRLNRVALNPFKNWKIPATSSTVVPPPPTESAPSTSTAAKNVDNTAKRRKKKEAEPPPKQPPPKQPPPKPAPPLQLEVNRPPKSTSPDVPEQMVPLENYYYGTIDNYPPKTNVTLSLKCPFCKEVYNNNITLMSHLFKHAHNVVKDGQMCRYCLTSVPTANDLLKHVASSHPSETKHDNGFVCLICETQYMNPFVLGKHMSKEHCPSELPYQCGTCGYRCSNHKQAIDHFYKQHDNGPTIQCPFCLKSTTVFSSSRNIAQNMHYFIQHLQKHQRKQFAKRCGKCNLWFIQKDVLKEHQTKMHASQRGKTGMVPWVAPRTGVMAPKSKMDKYPCDGDGINFSTLFYNVAKGLKCKECNGPMDSTKHFPSFESCQNPNCQYSTCCSNAMQDHNAKCNKNTQLSIPEEKLPFEMFCICGYSSQDGNQMAKHLATCEKKSAYPSLSDAKSASVTHSMLDVLGLVRKPDENDKRVTAPSRTTRRKQVRSEPVATITLDDDDTDSLNGKTEKTKAKNDGKSSKKSTESEIKAKGDNKSQKNRADEGAVEDGPPKKKFKLDISVAESDNGNKSGGISEVAFDSQEAPSIDLTDKEVVKTEEKDDAKATETDSTQVEEPMDTPDGKDETDTQQTSNKGDEGEKLSVVEEPMDTPNGKDETDTQQTANEGDEGEKLPVEAESNEEQPEAGTDESKTVDQQTEEETGPTVETVDDDQTVDQRVIEDSPLQRQHNIDENDVPMADETAKDASETFKSESDAANQAAKDNDEREVVIDEKADLEDTKSEGGGRSDVEQDEKTESELNEERSESIDPQPMEELQTVDEDKEENPNTENEIPDETQSYQNESNSKRQDVIETPPGLDENNENSSQVLENPDITEPAHSSEASVREDVLPQPENTETKSLECVEALSSVLEDSEATKPEVESQENLQNVLDRMDYEDISNSGLDSFAAMETD